MAGHPLEPSVVVPESSFKDGPTLPKQIGRYEVIEPIAHGATGSVLLGRDPVLDRRVAVKFLRQDLKLSPEERSALLSRMRQEAKASARVSHPHIIGLFDMGEDPELGVYLVFEHAEGITLKSRLIRGPLSPTSTAQLAVELGDALTTAHRARVLHRDIKPENIILTKTGAKIADFGVARVPESTLTKSGEVLGTPAYSAPESITHGEHSPASDQFALAATLYEALSAHRAFPGDDAIGVATRIQTEDPLPIAKSLDLDLAIDRVLARALHKNPALRFSSCAEMGRALSDAIAPGERPSRAHLATVPDTRHRRIVAADLGAARPWRIALGGLLVGALATLLIYRVSEELTEAAPTPERIVPKSSAWLSAEPKTPSNKPIPNGTAAMTLASRPTPEPRDEVTKQAPTQAPPPQIEPQTIAPAPETAR